MALPADSVSSATLDLKHYIRDIPDFPKPGIVFKDIMPLLADPKAFAATIDQLVEQCAGLNPNLIAAAEARGFIFAAPLALRLGIGMVPIRKPGKLPYHTVAMEYALEYGNDRLEMHTDALDGGKRVLLLDDVLATGGTMRACCDLITRAGGEVVACAFVVELGFLEGRARLEPYNVMSLLKY